MQGNTSRRITTIGAIALLAWCPVFGQGIGTPSGLGEVPQLRFEHRQILTPNVLEFSGFTPGSPLVMFFATASAPWPLAAFGLGPAVLGPSTAPSAGSAIFDGIFADTDGRFTFTTQVPPSLLHFPLHLQALGLDAAAPHGGVCLSDHGIFVFGFERDGFPAAVSVGSGRYALLELFDYGALAAPVDSRLGGVGFVDLSLSNDPEMAWGRSDRPTADGHAALGNRIRLADGRSLLGVRSAAFEDGIVSIDDDGHLRTLLWAQGTAIESAVSFEIAASPFEPLIAVAAETPLTEYGGAGLLVIRTDGGNRPGTHLPWTAVPLPTGLDVDSTSLCFLDGALFFGDGESGLWRYDLELGTTSPVFFPPSGGSSPLYLDETCAPAADGSALAIGAGASGVLHDIYVVSNSGTAINISQLPADYEDAAIAQADGMQLAMSDDGQQVAYMYTLIETETFVRAADGSGPESQVTNGSQFIDSIDTVVGVGFAAGPDLLIVAGKDIDSTDVYRAAIPAVAGPVVNIENISATSGTTTPVFGLGATLELRRRFRVGATIVLELASTAGGHRLELIPAFGSHLELSVGTVRSITPLAGGFIIADSLNGGELRLRRVSAGPTHTVTASWTSVGPAALASRSAARPEGIAFLVSSGGQVDLIRFDSGGQLTVHGGPSEAPGEAMAIDSMGRIVVGVNGPGGTVGIERFDPVSGNWSFSLPLTMGAGSGLFID